MPTADENNLRHALARDCHDPDCEIHNPDVGIREEVVSNTNLAFYLAGAQYVLDLLGSYRDDSAHDGESPDLDETDLTEAYNAVVRRVTTPAP